MAPEPVVAKDFPISERGEPFELAAIDSRLAFFADPFGNLFELKQALTPAAAW